MNLHPEFYTDKAGVVFSTEEIGVCASPDGYIICPCHGRGCLEGKCAWTHRNEKLEVVAQTSQNFCLGYDPDALDYKFFLKPTHPYYYQVQTQMMVTGTTFCIFMVHTDVDIAVEFVSRDCKVCEEIKVKSAQFFSKVLLPQMIAEWFVKTKYQPTITNPVQILDDSEFLEENELQQEPESTPIVESIPNERNADVMSQPSTSRQTHMYSCCIGGGGDKGPTVVCSNIDCLISVYHKSCVKPPRKRFGKTWKCKPCADTEKKRKRAITKENKENAEVPSKVRKVIKHHPLKTINCNQTSRQ